MSVHHYSAAFQAALAARNTALTSTPGHKEELFASYARHDFYRSFNTFALDFGRRTEKSEFAVELLVRNTAKAVVVAPNYEMLQHLSRRIEARRDLDKCSVNIAAVAKRRLISSKALSTTSSSAPAVSPEELLVSEASLIIIDETAMADSNTLTAVYSLARGIDTIILILGE